MTVTRARSLCALLVATTLALLAACGTAPSHTTTQPSTQAAASLNDVTPLTDAKAWQGPSTAVLAGADQPLEGTAATQELPVTYTDYQGTQVTITDASRVLALDIYGTLARTVYDLGLGDTLVGRDTSTTFPAAQDLPLVTPSGHDLSAEAILGLNPSVLITDTTLGPRDVVLQIREAGIPVVILDPHRTLENAGDVIRSVATVLGVPDAGDELAQRTEQQVQDVETQIAQIAPTGDNALRIAFLYVRGSAGVYYLFGSGSGVDSLVTALGGIDVATEVGWAGMRPVTDEGLIAMAPDLVLLMTAGLESVGGVDGLLQTIPALAQTPAGQHRRFVDMADSDILSFGPRSADVLEALAVAIYAPQATGSSPLAGDGR